MYQRWSWMPVPNQPSGESSNRLLDATLAAMGCQSEAPAGRLQSCSIRAVSLGDGRTPRLELWIPAPAFARVTFFRGKERLGQIPLGGRTLQSSWSHPPFPRRRESRHPAKRRLVYAKRHRRRNGERAGRKPTLIQPGTRCSSTGWLTPTVVGPGRGCKVRRRWWTGRP